MYRFRALVCFVLLVQPPSAMATVVYHRVHTSQIVAARDDGSRGRVIAHGRVALLAPRGGRVAVGAHVRRATGAPDLRVTSVRGGRERLLMHSADFGGSEPAFSPSWSPNGRYLLAGSAEDGDGFLFDLNAPRRLNLHLTVYGGASFAPDAKRVAVEVTDQEPELFIYQLAHHGRKRVARGIDPLWGAGGLAFLGPGGGLRLLRRPEQENRSRLLMPQPTDGSLQPVGWSSRGDRMLVANDVVRGPMKAELIAPSTGELTTLPQDFTEINGLSRDGRHVLGVIGGNVVSARPDGTTTILARSADNPSWDR